MTFIKDTVRGFLKIATAGDVLGEEINIASQTEISIGDLAQKIINIINPEAKIVRDKARIRSPKSEVERLLGSNKKIHELIGWKPEYTLEKGLQETIAWFKDGQNIKQYKPHLYNV